MKAKWWHWLERENVPVLYAVLRHRSHPFKEEFKEFTSTYLRLVFVWKKGVLHIYWKQEDLDKFNEFYINKVKKKTDFIKELESLHYAHSAKLINFSSTFPNLDFSAMSNQHLEQLLKKYNKLYLNLTLYTCIGIVGSFALEDVLVPYLKQKLKSAGKEPEFGEYFSILSNHSGKSWKRIEEESLLEIAHHVKSKGMHHAQVQSMIDKHVSNYCWLELGYQFLGKPLGREHFVSRLSHIVEHGLAELPPLEVTNKWRRQIVKELAIDKEHDAMFAALGKLIYLKEYRDGVYCRTQYELNFVIKEVLARFKIPERIGWHMTMQEYLDLLSGKGVEFEKIKHRKELFVWAYDNDEKYLVGSEAKQFIKNELKHLGVDIKKVKLLEGMVASPGYAKGIAKIVHNEAELGKVNAGDVLVAYMTKPSYLPAMYNAVAFVTNEGGVTCHAAIVSREMGKPCVIGTKIATKVFKDGDFIEVDANKGIVRRVKR